VFFLANNNTGENVALSKKVYAKKLWPNPKNFGKKMHHKKEVCFLIIRQLFFIMGM